MNTYRIINTTNGLGKRELHYNSTLDIVYIDGMTNKTIKLAPGATMYLTLNSIPMSVRKLIVKRMVDVAEISENQLKEIMKPIVKPVIVPELVVQVLPAPKIIKKKEKNDEQ